MNSRTDEKTRVILYGIGAIGAELARFALTRPALEIVGAVDADAAKVGRDLGSVLGLPKGVGIEVKNDPAALFKSSPADIVLLTTGSFLPAIYDQLELAAENRLNVVTSAEELAFPTLQSADLALKLDALAKKHGITIRGAGVNPGFVMDTLIVFLTGASADVEYVSAKRVVDCLQRRKQLQMKIGAGLSLDQFKSSIGKEIFGHVGLLESAALVADGIGIIPDRITQSIEPVKTEEAIAGRYVSVRPGDVCGMRQVARCLKAGREFVTLEVLFYAGAKDPGDHVLIKGLTNIDLAVKNGIAGDEATVAILINSIIPTLRASPGLLTPTGKSVAEISWRCPVDLGY